MPAATFYQPVEHILDGLCEYEYYNQATDSFSKDTKSRICHVILPDKSDVLLMIFTIRNQLGIWKIHSEGRMRTDPGSTVPLRNTARRLAAKKGWKYIAIAVAPEDVPEDQVIADYVVSIESYTYGDNTVYPLTADLEILIQNEEPDFYRTHALINGIRHSLAYIKKECLISYLTFFDDRPYGIFQNENQTLLDEDDYFSLPQIEPRTHKLYPLNCILYGAPGTGKTYATAQYAVAIAENKELSEVINEARPEIKKRYNEYLDSGRIVFTTFHQSYGYEEFIQGIRPDTSSGELTFATVDGVFKVIAERAMRDPGQNYIIIIDEINRASISKTFGELITLIEDDKRWGEADAISVILPSGDQFAVPNNLYIIGTMNSADKSISLIDTALRRRFEFVEFIPNLTLIEDVKLRQVLKKLNDGIINELNSTDLLIGHSYFLHKSEEDLCNIMNRSIIPLLYEYFFDDTRKVKARVEDAITGLNVEVEAGSIGRIKLIRKPE